MIKKILLGFLIVVLLVIIGGYAYYRFVLYEPPLISEEDRSELMVMPLPTSMEFTGDELIIDQGFGFQVTGTSSEKLDRAVSRFRSQLSEMTGIQFQQNGSDSAELSVTIERVGHPVPVGDEDESYQLKITASGIELTAISDYGAIHGLETLLQLVNGTALPTLELRDQPRFQWRGRMIDVSRHWMPKEVILRNLDAMAAVKMNVLHLHLSDDQGFRLESNTFPRLHEVGSNGKYFTQEEMREIISYAADRGIRIIPEFDIPGHTKSWLIAYPEYASIEKEFQFGRTRDDELFSVPMDPTREETYEFLDDFFAEMAELFPDPYMHIGGDEVEPTYWEESERIREFMDQNGLEDSHELQAYFNERISRILTEHGKMMIGWEEILNPELPEDVIVQSWINQTSLFEAVQSGYYGVLSAGLYLDHKLHASEHYQVDPLELPGAVEIEPDTTHWKMYDVTMDIPGDEMLSQLVIFDRNPGDVSGFFAMFDQRTGFTGGTLEGNQLSFVFETGNVGELSFDGEIIGDSLYGSISLGPLSFDAKGHLSGGHEIPGTEMPEIEVIEPLTDDQKARILGGEAAMWSEVVSAETIDSRIWPRTAAIAEKLWSPQELTGDVDDMYRRLESISDYLDQMGVQHIAYRESILREIGGEAYQPLKELVTVLEEAKRYTRLGFLLAMEEVYLPELELRYVADAAPPESMKAREFNRLVEEYYEDTTNSDSRDEILSHLETWSVLHEELSPYFDESEKLQEVEEISRQLAEVSDLAIHKMNGETDSLNQMEVEEKLINLEQGENGVIVAVVPGLRRILND